SPAQAAVRERARAGGLAEADELRGHQAAARGDVEPGLPPGARAVEDDRFERQPLDARAGLDAQPEPLRRPGAGLAQRAAGSPRPVPLRGARGSEQRPRVGARRDADVERVVRRDATGRMDEDLVPYAG